MKAITLALGFLTFLFTVNGNKTGDLPSRVNNAESEHFRNIFNQSNQACSQAAGIGYIFSYEMNSSRGTNGSTKSNIYPSHFSYNYLNNGNGNLTGLPTEGWDIAVDHGIPDMETYGGSHNALGVTGWMNGYDKYYTAMQNRATEYFRFPLQNEEQLNQIKSWLHNRNGATPESGGIIAANSFTGSWGFGAIAEGKHEAGKQVCYMKKWQLTGGHTFTLVGYDDYIEFDINGDGVINTSTTDLKTLEKGAFIMANTYGTNWKNGGYVYYMYQTAANFKNAIYGLKVNPDYKPQLTIKANIECNRRKKINIKAGIANGTDATTPEFTKTYAAFNFKRGGLYPMVDNGNNNPIEIGLDVTDLIEKVSNIENATLFLQIIADNDAALTGKVLIVSAISYMNHSAGFEFESGQNNVSIEVAGTINIPINLGKETSIQNSVKNNDIIVTPTTINLNKKLLGARYYLFDMNGKAIVEDTVNSLTINLSGTFLNKGVYVFSIVDNNKITSKKIVLY